MLSLDLSDLENPHGLFDDTDGRSHPHGSLQTIWCTRDFDATLGCTGGFSKGGRKGGVRRVTIILSTSLDLGESLSSRSFTEVQSLPWGPPRCNYCPLSRLPDCKHTQMVRSRNAWTQTNWGRCYNSSFSRRSMCRRFTCSVLYQKDESRKDWCTVTIPNR